MYCKVSGEPVLEQPTIDVSSKDFYGVGYDDSDKRIPDMTIINKQLGMLSHIFCKNIVRVNVLGFRFRDVLVLGLVKVCFE